MTEFHVVRDLLTPFAELLGDDYNVICGMRDGRLCFSVYKIDSEKPAWNLELEGAEDYELDPQPLLREFADAAKQWFAEPALQEG